MEPVIKKKIALLCDYGLDDAAATAYLIENSAGTERIDLVPIGGNMPLSVARRNARRLIFNLSGYADKLRLVDTSTIAQPEENLTFIHGEDGMGDVLSDETDQSVKELGFDEWVAGLDSDTLIVSLGPCTVTAEILKRKGNIPLLLMAGNIAEAPNHKGREFNHSLDAEAFAFTVKHPHLIATLDTCHHKNCDFYGIEPPSGRLSSLLISRVADIARSRQSKRAAVYDLVAVMAIFKPECFEVRLRRDPDGNMLNVLEYVSDTPLLGKFKTE